MTSLIEALGKVHLDDHSLDTDKAKEPEEPGNNKKDDEEGPEEEAPGFVEPFRFFDLPSEIRLRVYAFVLFTPRRNRPLFQSNGSVGASSKNPLPSPLAHRVNVFLVSHRMHDEASDYFYSSQAFRIFPVQDYSRVPIIKAIPSRYRPSIATIELILGSSWTAPPRSWKVNNSLGLEEMTRVLRLKVFIECDPSHPVFEGFRISKNFYSEFAGELLQKILQRLPSLKHVEFDGYPSVSKSGSLMKRLMHETKAANKNIAWGPQRGWTDWVEEDEFANPILQGLNIPRQAMGTALNVDERAKKSRQNRSGKVAYREVAGI